jgi:hypothetical protein
MSLTSFVGLLPRVNVGFRDGGNQVQTLFQASFILRSRGGQVTALVALSAVICSRLN